MIQVILGSIVFSGITFVMGYYKGRSAERNKQLKIGVTDAIKTKKRQAARRNDSHDTVKRRMRKYTRK